MSLLLRNAPSEDYSALETSFFELISILIIIIIIIMYCWLTAQLTAQGHLRAFHKFKFRTQVGYNTKYAHYIHVNHTNIIRKAVPSVSLS